MNNVTKHVLIRSNNGLKIDVFSESFSESTVVPHPAERTVPTKPIVQQTDIGSNSDTILQSLARGSTVASCAINIWQSSIEREK